MEHSILAPSGSDIWGECFGSIVMSAGIPDIETPDQAIGTATHWVGQSMLESMTGIDRQVPIASDWINRTAPNGVIVDEEMAECAQIYYRAVMDIAGKGHIRQLNVERRVSAQRIHEVCFGTPDADLYIDEERTLYLWDYKHGHRAVDPQSPQFVIYLAGRISELGLSDLDVKCKVYVVQPRCYDGKGPIRTWSVHATELRTEVNRLHYAAARALGNDPEIRAGRWCRDCKAKVICPANLQAVADAADFAATAVPHNPTPAALAYEMLSLMHAAALLKHRKDAVETEIIERLRAGQPIPGFALNQGYGHNAWIRPADQIFAMGVVLGLDMTDDPKPVTPTEAIRRCKAAGIDPSVLAGSYERPKTAMKLTVEDGRKAREVFQRHD